MASQPGKTAPRLIEDLLAYDLRYEERAGRNLLTSSPAHHDPGAPPRAAVPLRNCRHLLMIKHEQSKLPQGDIPSHGAVYKIASFCRKCRWHIDVKVDLRDDGSRTVLCRQMSEEYTLHHLQAMGEGEGGTGASGNPSRPRRFAFRCSAPKCPLALDVFIRPPQFSDHYISLLTNQTLLRKRLDDAKSLGSDRNDVQMARPVDGLDFLRTYLTDSLNPQKGKTRIPLLNRKFVKTFGVDCDEILMNLGFTPSKEIGDDGTETIGWHLPKAPAAGDPLDHNSERTVVEDAQHELSTLILEIPEAERTGVRHPPIGPQPSRKFIERALGCEEYRKRPASSTRNANSEEHPYYAGLGAVEDFADELLLFAYTRQVAVDLTNATYYFECLKDLAIGRRSGELETYVQLLASQGQTSRNEVAAAYRFFLIDPKHAPVLSDDHILGVFRSRLQDISSAAAEEARNALRTIGNARGSEKIRQEASNAIETYGQALSWLGLDESQPEEFIVTMYTIKVNENHANQEIARKAVSIIANYRNSRRLRDWLSTNVLEGSGEMDMGDAYALLDIKDRTMPIALDALQAQADSLAADNPSNKEKYQKAYDLICKEQLNNGLQDGFRPQKKSYPLESWPVGCFNIGNTCYLNSVLQFLFTIRPLRNMVLDCDSHLQEITPEALKEKRVGRSSVTVEKAERAQRFVRELRSLFQHMISANSERIRPRIELAGLALSKADAHGDIPALETPVGPDRQGLGHIGGLPIAGPMLDLGAADHAVHVTNPSMADSVMGDDDAVNDDASSMVAEADADSNDHATEKLAKRNGDGDKNDQENKLSPPSRPPPIPPRPQDIKKIEGLAEQQDAAEILNNVFDLLSCAFKGEGLMRDGEQEDLIKRLFFSDVTTVHLANGKETSRKSDLQDHLLVSSGGRNRPLYAALDGDFSLSEIEGGSSQNKVAKTTKYEYIADASPIQIINVRRLIYQGGETVKDESHLGLDPVLYLDRYLGRTDALDEHEIQGLREKQWRLQEKLKSLERRKKDLTETEIKTELPDAVNEAAVFLESIIKSDAEKLVDTDADPVPVSSELPDLLQAKADRLTTEKGMLDGQMKELDEQINTIFRDCEQHPYRLHTVFMHRGGAKGGHYWIYIYDFQNKMWRSYNDDDVEQVEDKKIFEEDGRATSTGLVFIRAELVDDLTQAVKRNPAPPSDREDGNDVEMKEANGLKDDDLPPVGDMEVIEGIEKA